MKQESSTRLDYQQLVDRLRRGVRREARFALEQLRYRVSEWASDSPVRILLVSDLEAATSETQFDPFFAHHAALRRELGVVFLHRRLAQVLQDPVSAVAGFDVIGLKLGFRTHPQTVLDIVRTLFDVKGAAKLVYFDGDDDSTIQWPAILPFFDLYVKKHMFQDLAEYQRSFVGRNNLTDYVAKAHGFSFADDMIPESTPVDPALLDRVCLGYNLALDRKIVDIYRRTQGRWRREDRPNDVVCRGQLTGWLRHLRKDVAPLLATLPPEIRCITPTARVSQEQYDEELHSSKICVSPFGFGELCWRDFEAVLWGCLMFKPDMSHIRTHPNIFIENETYVPLRWDLADLPEKCMYYLQHPEQRRRITENAYAVLEQYYESRAFIREVSAMLHRIGIQGTPRKDK